MKKKIGIISILILVVILVAIGLILINKNNNTQENNKSVITINVHNKENIKIYQEAIETDKKYLVDVLKDINKLKVVTQTGQYGEYINSIMDISQGENFYWSYYIDNNYATVGISNCKIEDGKIYDFKIESFNY